jgi:hypothetical protein
VLSTHCEYSQRQIALLAGTVGPEDLGGALPADRGTELFDLTLDHVADFARGLQLLFVCACAAAGSGKLQCKRVVTPGKMGQRSALT